MLDERQAKIALRMVLGKTLEIGILVGFGLFFPIYCFVVCGLRGPAIAVGSLVAFLILSAFLNWLWKD